MFAMFIITSLSVVFFLMALLAVINCREQRDIAIGQLNAAQDAVHRLTAKLAELEAKLKVSHGSYEVLQASYRSLHDDHDTWKRLANARAEIIKKHWTAVDNARLEIGDLAKHIHRMDSGLSMVVAKEMPK